MSKPTTTSSATFPPSKLTRIDALARLDHSFLLPADECHFLGEYTPRKGFAFSPTNNFVLNFKKRPGENGQSYKTTAIGVAAKTFSDLLNPEYLRGTILVPVPPSKHKSDPAYDDRVLRMVAAIVPRGGKASDLLVRELVVQTKTLPSAHDQAVRLRPDEIEAACKVDSKLVTVTPTSIAIFDDVLVTGARFKATQAVLLKKYPGIRTVGFFIARRIPDPE